MKKFSEVFPTLKLNSHLAGLLSECEVKKITTTSNRDCLKVYLESDYLLSWEDVSLLENEIASQLFKWGNVSVRVMMHYHLSEQYTAENLWDTYAESILMELSGTNHLLGQLLRDGEVSFSDSSHMRLVLNRSILAAERGKELARWIGEVIRDRCGQELEIELDEKDVDTSEMDKVLEQKLRSEICHVLEGLGEAPLGDEVSFGEGYEGDEVAFGTEHEGTEHEGAEHDGAGHKGAGATSGAETKSTVKVILGPENKSGKSAGSGRGDRSEQSATDPGMIYGKDFEGPELPVSQIDSIMGDVIIKGQVIALETREIRNQKTILMFDVTDFTDTITVKLFVKNEELTNILSDLKVKTFIRMMGTVAIDKFDGELTVLSVKGIKKVADFRKTRKDVSIEKRVELHCHTKMSDMDGITAASDIVNGAIAMGHPAVAITDHGVVHAFPEAFHTVRDAKKKSKSKAKETGEPDPLENFKVIYGMEGYVVDDLVDLVVNDRGQSLGDTFVVFDLETTGFNAIHDKIIEIGAVKVREGKILDRFSTYVNPGIPIPYRITELTGITDKMVMDSGTIEEHLPKFLKFVEDGVLVAHNAGFDMGFIEQNCRYQGIKREFTYVDTVNLSRVLLPSLSKYKLDAVAKHLGISLENHHRAVDDAECTAHIWLKLSELMEGEHISTLKDLNRIKTMTPEMMRKLPTHHIILLARNEEGRKNLYRLVSMSHLVYYGKRPRLPKSEIIKHREGLIIGSACVSGELFDALLGEKSPERIQKIVDFYDYLEVQPLANNRFLISEDKYTKITSDRDLIALNEKIISLGEENGKPVVATCDVHFFNPEDEIARRIIQAGNGYKDVDRPEPLYFRTTEEMLEEFNYLDPRKAYEIVVKNTNLIADMIEYIEPVRPDKCPPVIPDSDKILRESCYECAHKIYGDVLPEIVEKRLEKELNSIISNGFAVMYIIAQKLVRKSNEDGYLVGSRGSVGSSFVANMAGITEVNALAPHYYCTERHYVDFDSPEVKKFAGGCGWDMPDRSCPVCGKKLRKDGFNIPFETFLGFKGNKEPDIDLNFSGDYQAKAHKYTEEIFGQGQTFKAGTIATVADKMAYGYVLHYYEERGARKRPCEIKRVMQNCVGVRRSTGQHPGGIIVLPHGEEIHSFTPIQHPANDMTSDIITTHFDYHSIDHNLLKLDILGHDDPTMIRRLEDLIGINAKEIPLDDPGVLTLFSDTSALGITPEQIHGCPLGCLGIPEFGTDFVIQMLMDTKPRSFSDLVRISGLSHGTNVWLGNAQVLVQEGTTPLSGAICTRDDIMTFLIQKGVESEQAFTIMESVRKGKGLKPEWETIMKENNVPDWYIWSCKRISYMFPKAHAVAYVTMAYRIAYCKIYHPLAYYAAYFAIRASAFSYELMCLGKEKVTRTIDDYMAREELSVKESDTLKDLRVVEEMYARGFEFLPIDIYRAKAKEFQIIDGKLMASFSSIDGMGEKAAESLEAAAGDGVYLSKEDFRERGHVSKTLVDKMCELGLLENLPETNQISLFDFM